MRARLAVKRLLPELVNALLIGLGILSASLGLKGFLLGDVILGFNVALFLIAMSVLGVDAAPYSILTYVAAARTLDFVLYGIDEYTAITVMSDLNAAIRERITGDLARGVTVFRGYGGMRGTEQDILYCVVTRLEVAR